MIAEAKTLTFEMEVNDPIHGFIRLSKTEQKIIDTHAFQRLRRIKQLSGGHFVYPTAEHTRFGHSLGTMFIASLLGRRILEQLDLDSDRLDELRLAALLHDIGHGPFSHVFEEVLLEHRGMNHEDVTEWVIKKSRIGDILDDNGYSKERIARLVRGTLKDRVDLVLGSLVAGQVDADKLDYLIRDSFYCGVSYGLVDFHRLIDSLEVSDELVLEFALAARGALEAFLVARYEMFMNVYFHKTVRSVEVMLVQLMSAADEPLGLTRFSSPDEFLALDDVSMISQIRRLDPQDSEDTREASRLMKMLDCRVLYKSAFEKILHTPDRFVSKLLTKKKVCESIQEEIATRADVPVEAVIVDVPSLPSVPYNPLQEKPMEVNIFEMIEGQKVSHYLSEFSKIGDVMRGYFDVIRVYTTPQYRLQVGRAARSIFREVPESALIHM